MARGSRNLSQRLEPRAKLWLEVDGQYVFGLGISDALKAVRQTGSIKAAAKELGKSYRYIWDKIKQAERALGAALVLTQVGGKDARRSELTALAQELVIEFDTLRDHLLGQIQGDFRERLRAAVRRHVPR